MTDLRKATDRDTEMLSRVERDRTFRCVRCHRALTREGVNGLGPTCLAKAAQPQEAGMFDIEKSVANARRRVASHIKSMTDEAMAIVRLQFAWARERQERGVFDGELVALVAAISAGNKHPEVKW
jgi:hypothetical protein